MLRTHQSSFIKVLLILFPSPPHKPSMGAMAHLMQKYAQIVECGLLGRRIVNKPIVDSEI